LNFILPRFLPRVASSVVNPQMRVLGSFAGIGEKNYKNHICFSNFVLFVASNRKMFSIITERCHSFHREDYIMRWATKFRISKGHYFYIHLYSPTQVQKTEDFAHYTYNAKFN